MTGRHGFPTVLALVLVVSPAWAQETDDQTRDYEDQDRRYYERYLEQQEQEQEQAPAEPEQDPAEAAAAEFTARAEELVKDKNYWGRNSERYMIETDDPALDSKAVLELLDSFREFFDEYWGPRIEMHDYDTMSRVFLYDSFYKYNELLGFDARRMPVRPEGHYISAFNVLVVHTRGSAPEGLADSLVHEAAHQLIDQRIYGGSGVASVWVGEGLASYFGFTYRDKSGAFRPGRTGGKSIALFKDTKPGSSDEPSQRVKRLRRALKSAQPGWLEAMLEAGPGEFYGGNIELNYTAAWVLVHYLLHGDDGRHAAAFATYLEGEAAGRSGAAVLYETLGVSGTDLETALTDYVGKLKTG